MRDKEKQKRSVAIRVRRAARVRRTGNESVTLFIVVVGRVRPRVVCGSATAPQLRSIVPIVFNTEPVVPVPIRRNRQVRTPNCAVASGENIREV